MNKLIAMDKLRNGQSIFVRKLLMNDLPFIMELQKNVASTLESDSFLQSLSEEEFSFIFSGNGMILGVFTEDKLIAFRAMLIPELDDEHLGIDVGLKEDELSKVIYSEISCVNPNYRGNGLQTFMGRLLMEEVDTEQFHYICATVAPLNIPSLKDKLALGMEVVALKEKYGGKLRYILMKKLVNPSYGYNGEEVLLGMNDVKEQQKILQLGYRGIAIEQYDGKWFVRYRLLG